MREQRQKEEAPRRGFLFFAVFLWDLTNAEAYDRMTGNKSLARGEDESGTMNLFLTLAFLFFIGSVTGWVIELLFRRFFLCQSGTQVD